MQRANAPSSALPSAPSTALGPRILVIGAPGAGKSKLAKTLSCTLGAPVHHLDDLAWLPGWRRRPPGEFLELQRDIVATERWIVEGWHAPSLALRLKAATGVVILRVPAPTCLWRFYARAWRRWALGDASSLPAPLRAGHRRLQPVAPDPRMLARILAAPRRLRATREIIEREYRGIRVVELSTQTAASLARSEAFP